MEALAPAEAVGRLQQQMSGIEAALAKLLGAQAQAAAAPLPPPEAAAKDRSGSSPPQRPLLDQLLQRESGGNDDGSLTARGIERGTAGGAGGGGELALASEAPACQISATPPRPTTEFSLPGQCVISEETASSSFRQRSVQQPDRGGGPSAGKE